MLGFVFSSGGVELHGRQHRIAAQQLNLPLIVHIRAAEVDAWQISGKSRLLAVTGTDNALVAIRIALLLRTAMFRHESSDTVCPRHAEAAPKRANVVTNPFRITLVVSFTRQKTMNRLQVEFILIKYSTKLAYICLTKRLCNYNYQVIRKNRTSFSPNFLTVHFPDITARCHTRPEGLPG